MKRVVASLFTITVAATTVVASTLPVSGPGTPVPVVAKAPPPPPVWAHPFPICQPITDWGDPNLPHGYADVDGDGVADYCRFRGVPPHRFLSCQHALVDLPDQGGCYAPDSEAFNSWEGIDPGVGNGTFVDRNKDGRADFCRSIQVAGRVFEACDLAWPGGFSPSENRPTTSAGYWSIIGDFLPFSSHAVDLATNVQLSSAPAVFSDGTGRQIFHRGTDNGLWFARYYLGNTTTGGLQRLPNVTSRSAPSFVVGTGELEVFYRGANDHLWQVPFPGYWGTPVDRGGYQLTSAPSMVKAGNETVAFYRGPGPQYTLVTMRSNYWGSEMYHLGTWSHDKEVTSDPSAVVVADRQMPLWVFYRGSDDRLWMRRCTATGYYCDAPVALRTPELESGPTAHVLSGGDVQVFFTTAGDTLASIVWWHTKNRWSEPLLYKSIAADYLGAGADGEVFHRLPNGDFALAYGLGVPPPPPAPRITGFAAAPHYVCLGQQSTLTWSIDNCGTDCHVSIEINDGHSDEVLSGLDRTGSLPIYPKQQTTTCTLSATSEGGTDSARKIITIASCTNKTTSSDGLFFFRVGCPGTVTDLCLPTKLSGYYPDEQTGVADIASAYPDTCVVEPITEEEFNDFNHWCVGGADAGNTCNSNDDCSGGQCC